MPRMLSCSTNSQESLDFAVGRFQACIRDHDQCKRGSDLAWLPTRLIDLASCDVDHSARLILSTEIKTRQDYCTLSHCWGSVEFLKLKRDNYDSFRYGTLISNLSKTFQDSFLVARKLGIRYIWVDSLCIIQDDPDDWVNEASQMDKVYSNSLCNICATGFEDSSNGFFTKRDPTNLAPCDVEIPWLDGGGIFRILDATLWRTQVLNAPLNVRAWAVQEYLLAPRHIHFGDKQILWECLESSAAEQFPSGMPKAAQSMTQSARKTLHVSEGSKNNEMQLAKSLRSDWSQMVRQYTKAKLSHPTDKVIAFSGITKRFESLLDDQCLAGLWRSEMERELLWHVDYCRQGDGSASTKPEAWRAPSFSWMSVDAAVHVNWDPEPTDDVLIKVLSANIEQAQSIITRSSYLRIKCKLKRMKLRRDMSTSGVQWLGRFQHGKPELGWALAMTCTVLMDVDRDYESGGTYFCMPIISQAAYFLVGLVLQKAAGRAAGEFERIGFFKCSGEEKILLLRDNYSEKNAYSCDFIKTQQEDIITLV